MSIAKAERHLLQGDIRSALAIANQALQLDPSNSFCRQFRAWIYQCVGGSSISLALVDYRRCLEQRPHDPSILIDRAIAYIRQSDYHLAVRDLTQVIHRPQTESFSFAYWLRSLAYRLLGQIDKSLIDLDGAINLDPEQLHYRISRADLYRHLRNNQQASSDVEFILNKLPNDPDINQTRSHLSKVISVKSDVIPKATAAGLEAIQKYRLRQYHDIIRIGYDYKDDVSVQMMTALSYLELGNLQAALQTINRTLILAPATPVLFYIRGLVFKQFNSPTAALANFRDAFSICPEFSSASKAILAIESELDNVIRNKSSISRQILQSWSCDRVVLWLRQHHINTEIVKRFQDFAIDGQTLSRCDDDDLKFIGIGSKALRQTILDTIQGEKDKPRLFCQQLRAPNQKDNF